MCGGKKKSTPAPQVLPAPPAPPGYQMDSGGVIRDATGSGTASTASLAAEQTQPASFGAELGTAQ
jgi:hypothetical protein